MLRLTPRRERSKKWSWMGRSMRAARFSKVKNPATMIADMRSILRLEERGGLGAIASVQGSTSIQEHFEVASRHAL